MQSQGPEVDYALHTLGWKAFQQLCLTVVADVWGQTVQGFCDSHDGGRDGAFYGAWQSQSGESFPGSFTVQCKFSAKSESRLRLKTMSDELNKAKRLASRGLADNYILFTNSRVTGSTAESVQSAFQAIPGIQHFAVYGSERLSAFIRESTRLRMLVPRVYGLGDLSQILDGRAYDQAVSILSAIGDDLSKFVITGAYTKSARALMEHGFVFLLGEPACGKSTIAAALAVSGLDEWRLKTVKVRGPDEFVSHWNPHEAKQLFWVDDAFGATQVDWHAAVRWNATFPQIHAAIKRGAKFVFTSRDYIYKAARRSLKESALPVLQESQVVINVQDLTKDEREQILYNHIRLGSQPESFKSAVKPLLPLVAEHERFSPEIARRLGHPAFTKDLSLTPYGVGSFVANPMDLLKEIIRTLDSDSRAAIALLFMRGGEMPSPVTLSQAEDAAIVTLGGSASQIRAAISALEGSLLIKVTENSEVLWRYKHPTIRDAFAALVSEDRELMDIYLTGTPLPQLFGEVTCGDVGIDGVKVIVPVDRYDVVLTRMRPLLLQRHDRREGLYRFLAARCDSQFLLRMISDNEGFVEGLSVTSYLAYCTDLDVLVRLHELNILAEPARAKAVASIASLARCTPDAGFLDSDVRTIFHGSEFADLLAILKSTLLPQLTRLIAERADEFEESEEPEDHFYFFRQSLQELKTEFDSDAKASAQLGSALVLIEQTIEQLKQTPEAVRVGEYTGAKIAGVGTVSARSIFDDVDQ